MITIKEIARQLDMSTTTVSNVIHGKTKEVSPETIERVQRFLDQVEYVPNMTARNLAQNKSKIIGAVLKTTEDRYSHILMDPFVSEMLGGIETAVREAGYFLMLYISDDIAEIIERITTWNADGLLLFWMMDDDAARVHKKYRKPVVSIDTYMSRETAEQFDQDLLVNIGLEDEQGAYDATSYLIGKGHRKIAFLSDKKDGVDQMRFRGYRRALSDAGIEYSDRYYFLMRSTRDEIDESLDRLAEKARKVTAVVCTSDMFAAMFLNACIRHGLRVPEDISFVGFDDITNISSRLCRPRLTTVHQDIGGKGMLAANTLIGMIQGRNPSGSEIIMNTRLVERESVADRRQ
ncbi:MAG: LacI family transcriptional regulator [Lachnospiraceae bacterium]|nr:LacI family transcriptional regulator [Lachnospiraceae bacterium]